MNNNRGSESSRCFFFARVYNTFSKCRVYIKNIVYGIDKYSRYM